MGDLAKRTGKTVRALHLYEEHGLLRPRRALQGGYRLYNRESELRVRWIDKLQQMGFSLTDIKQIVRDVERSKNAPHAMQRVQDLFREKLDETREQLRRLQRARERADRQPHLPRDLRQLRHRRAARRLHRVRAPRMRAQDARPGRRLPRALTLRAPLMLRKASSSWLSSLPIYMDNHATTPVDPRVVEAMLPYFTQNFGNAASRNHAFGWKAEEAVEYAREQVAKLIGAQSDKEIVFTSGATESDNLAIKGVAEFYKDKGNHIITTRTEHKAVLDTCKRLEKQGFAGHLPATSARTAWCRPEQVAAAITDKTILVSHHAREQRGRHGPAARRDRQDHAREGRALPHATPCRASARSPFDVEAMNVDLASITAHKMYGPKGVGALYVRRSKPRVRLVAQMDGGGHERGMRSGTLNVPGIVGFGKAAEIAQQGVARRRPSASSACASACARSCSRRSTTIHLNGADDRTACPATSTSRSPSSRARP